MSNLNGVAKLWFKKCRKLIEGGSSLAEAVAIVPETWRAEVRSALEEIDTED